MAKKKHWFKQKIFGWGFVPVTKEGWLATLILVGVLLLATRTSFINDYDFLTKDGIWYLIKVLVICTFFTLAFKDRVKGGLRWNWGKRKED